MNKVLIAIPTMGSLHTLLVSRIIDWTVDPSFQKQFYFTMNVSPVDRAREEIIDAFLKTDCTHVFMVDSDTIPPKDAIRKLLAVNTPIATGLTPMVRFDAESRNKDIKASYYSLYNAVGLDTKHLQPDTGIVECLGAGGSCLLIARQVAQKVARPLFRNVYEDDKGKQEFISEDIYFITKARKFSLKTFADTSVLCWHSKTTIF